MLVFVLNIRREWTKGRVVGSTGCDKQLALFCASVDTRLGNAVRISNLSNRVVTGLVHLHCDIDLRFICLWATAFPAARPGCLKAGIGSLPDQAALETGLRTFSCTSSYGTGRPSVARCSSGASQASFSDLRPLRNQRIRSSSAPMKSARLHSDQSAGWKNSLLSVPKKPSIRALSGLRPLRGM